MKNRILTSLVLAPIAIAACVLRTPYLLLSICLLVATLGFWELRTLLRQPKALPVLTLFGLAVPFFGTEIQANRDPIQVLLYAPIFWLMGLAFCAYAAKSVKNNAASVDMAGLWICMPLTCILMLHKLIPPHQPYITYQCFPLLILIPLWAGDVAGLVVGSKFGKHPLASKVSPKKSWEGAIANLLTCVVVSAAMVYPLGDSNRLPLHLLCGVTIGVVGQCGDLFESWVKRTTGVKDSGSILPGHGGVLDRIDSLLFTAPLVCLELVVAFH